MAECPDIVGVRNVLISFKDCDNDQEMRNVVHKVASDTLPTYNLCNYVLTALPGGKVQRSEGTGFTLEIEIQVVDGIPTAWYTGCAAIDVTLDYYDGKVLTFLNGAIIDSGGTDGNTVVISAVFKDADELFAEGMAETDTPALA